MEYKHHTVAEAIVKATDALKNNPHLSHEERPRYLRRLLHSVGATIPAEWDSRTKATLSLSLNSAATDPVEQIFEQ